jgi:hypothetical protein
LEDTASTAVRNNAVYEEKSRTVRDGVVEEVTRKLYPFKPVKTKTTTYN